MRFSIVGSSFACMLLLAACSKGGDWTAPLLPTSNNNLSNGQAVVEESTSTAPEPLRAPPQMISISFAHTKTIDPTYGPVYYYSLMPTGAAEVIRVKSRSQVVFVNDQSPASDTSHTAGGFGTSGFPSSFDNPNRFTRVGRKIDASFWSTGSLSPGGMSQVFTVGPPGAYYFGCGYHYTTVPTKRNHSMGDVLVAN